MLSQSVPSATPRAFRARWVFPIDRPPIAHGIVRTCNGRIISMGTSAEGGECTDLGDVALLPGLVNCHTHLEFSDCTQPLGTAGLSFPDWIDQVVKLRRARASTCDTAARDAIANGLRECWNNGTVAVGEIATQNWTEYACIAQSPDETPYLIRFGELLGMAPDKTAILSEKAREHIQHAQPLSAVGLSPHAPYTVHPDVLQCAIDISAQFGVPIAMHLAESLEEIELLHRRSGKFIGLLSRLNAWHPEVPIHQRPLGYLEALSKATRALVIHGNYLDADEIAYLGEHRNTMSVVYCPRTHHFFRHSRYPLEKMLAAGIRVALGTDSRASNPDLALFEEMRYVASNYSAISPEIIVRMGTLEGATALGIDDDYGAIRTGTRAHLAIATLGDSTADPYEALWSAAQITALAL